MSKYAEYPEPHWHIAYIVKYEGIAMRHNGVGMYMGWTERSPGEVFFSRKDAEFVAKEKRRYSPEPEKVTIQSVMVPSSFRPSEHVRALRIEKEDRKA